MSQNYFLELGDRPRYDLLDHTMIAPAMRELMEKANAAIAKIKADGEPTWANTNEAMTDAMEEFSKAWGTVSHILSVRDEKEWRDEYNALVQEVTIFYSNIMQDIELYERFKKIKANEYDKLDPARRKALDDSIRDFVLSGAELPPEKQKRFQEVSMEMAELTTRFAQNALDATQAFKKRIPRSDKSLLDGVPDDVLRMFEEEAKKENFDGWIAGLSMPHYVAIMTHAKNRDLRAEFHKAYMTRASDLGSDKEKDNGPVIDRILELAEEEAHLLGYPNYAELSLVPKMADSHEKVIEFIRDMAKKARPFCDKELKDFEEFARKELGLDSLQPYDISFVTENVRQKRYALSKEEIRKYFPHDKAIHGLFDLIERMYGVTFEKEERPVWHPDVIFYNLMKDGKKIGGLYMDLFAREGKRQGAWMNDYQGRRKKKDGSIQLPIAYLVCNFQPLIDGKSYLTHDELETLFHECGHGLHHLLTKVDELDVSGINGVEWDAVELPSQFMENFTWDYDNLVKMSEHKETGEKLPKELFEKMKATKNFNNGMFIARQMEFALFDMRIYSMKSPVDWMGEMRRVCKEISDYPHKDYERFPQCFSHIFAGGYSAGYYSYIWAEVLSADVFESFEEEKDLKATGARFLKEILSVGGSRPMAESFRAFKGRDPMPEPLLRHLGFIGA